MPTTAFLGFRAPLAAPGRSFAITLPLRKSTLRPQAAGPPSPRPPQRPRRQAGRLQRAVDGAKRDGAKRAVNSWLPEPSNSWHFKLYLSSVALSGAAILYSKGDNWSAFNMFIFVVLIVVVPLQW
ncbi:hypothetical protein ABPG77_004844 [Micractinium sp. CCAP 211/92]